MKFLFFPVLCSSLVIPQEVINYQGDKINEIVDGKKGLGKLTDSKRGAIISCQMLNDTVASSVDCDQYGKLTVTQSKTDNLIFYRNGETIYGILIKEIKGIRFIKDIGAELDAELSKLYDSISFVKPVYYGGPKALTEYVRADTDYQKTDNRAGQVKVDFIVDKNGFLETAKVIRTDAFLNDEPL